MIELLFGPKVIDNNVHKELHKNDNNMNKPIHDLINKYTKKQSFDYEFTAICNLIYRCTEYDVDTRIDWIDLFANVDKLYVYKNKHTYNITSPFNNKTI